MFNCELCGDGGAIEHHICYKPEKVILVCKSCHSNIHYKNIRPDLCPEKGEDYFGRLRYTGPARKKLLSKFISIKIPLKELAMWQKKNSCKSFRLWCESLIYPALEEAIK